MDKNKYLSKISASLLLLVVLLSLIFNIIEYTKGNYTGILNVFLFSIFYIPFIVFLFIGKKNIGLLITFIIFVLYGLINSIVGKYTIGIIEKVIYIILIALLFLNIDKEKYNYSRESKVLFIIFIILFIIFFAIEISQAILIIPKIIYYGCISLTNTILMNISIIIFARWLVIADKKKNIDNNFSYFPYKNNNQYDIKEKELNKKDNIYNKDNSNIENVCNKNNSIDYNLNNISGENKKENNIEKK